MKRLLIAGALLLAGCSAPLPAPTTTTPATAAPIAPTTAAPTTSSVAPATTTTPVTYQTCLGEESLLCEVYLLIGEEYVDDVADVELARAAAAEVDALDVGTRDQPGDCLIPNDTFVLVCEALIDEGVGFADAEEPAIQGMMEALDPASAYFDQEALRALRQDQSGQVEGIGAVVVTEDTTAPDPSTEACNLISATCRIVIVSTVTGGPAERAGILAGDVFVAVNGESVAGKTIDEVTAEVRGPAGTEVSLTFLRNGRELEFDLIREAVLVPVVESDVVDDTGYLRLNQFTDNSDEIFHDTLDSLLAAGIDRLVLDLRDNPGGALFATIEIASEFFDSGIVVRTVGQQDDRDYRAQDGGLLARNPIPVVILVNRGSASASEVLSAALQERELATVIGTNTFGKNTVQQEYGLSNGGAVKLTVARWVTEAGTDFGEVGVTPDVEAELEEDLSVAELVAEVSSLTGW